MLEFIKENPDEDLNKKEKIGQVEMTYMDIWLAESLDYSIKK